MRTGHPLGKQLGELKRRFEHDGLRSDMVYRTLREAIVRGVLREGDRLQDRALAQSLAVSRTPIREALQRLEAESLVVNLPRQGLVVAEFTPQDIEHVYTIRITLEALAARLAAQHASPADLLLLEDLHARIQRSTEQGDVETITALNKEFHDALYTATGNPRLGALLNRLHDTVQRFSRTTLGYPGRAGEALLEHRQLLDAIAARNPALAEEIAARHMTNAMHVRLRMFRQTPPADSGPRAPEVAAVARPAPVEARSRTRGGGHRRPRGTRSG